MTNEHTSDTSVTTVLKRCIVIALISLTTFTSMTAITSCSNSKQEDNKDGSSAQQHKTEVIAVTANESDANVNGNHTDTASGDEAAIVDGKRIHYDVNNWDTGGDERYTLDELKKIQEMLGNVTSTDNNSLDFANNTAIKYRFMQGDAPYLDIIDSQHYFELGWYYANPDDSQEQKQNSIDHAKKAYKIANHIMGEAGGDLVRRMLTNQIIKNEEVGGQYIQLAKCEFYSCMLIIKKQNS